MTGAVSDSEIERISSIVSPIASRLGIEKVYLFGSRARGDNRGDSDYDFYVHSGEVDSILGMIGLMEELSKDLNREVDVVDAAVRDHPLLKRIDSEKVLIYER